FRRSRAIVREGNELLPECRCICIDLRNNGRKTHIVVVGAGSNDRYFMCKQCQERTARSRATFACGNNGGSGSSHPLRYFGGFNPAGKGNMPSDAARDRVIAALPLIFFVGDPSDDG